MVLLCTPNAHHYEGVIESARLGLHVLCEKPMHFSPEKQDEMIRVCKKHGVKLGVCYRREFMKIYMVLKDFIQSGKLGKVLYVDTFMKFWREPEYFTELSWHGKPELEGGGSFMQQGVHYIDIAAWLCNGWKRIITGRLFTLHQPTVCEDHGYTVIEYANNAIGVIEISSVTKNNPYVSRLEISGTKGSITITNDKITYWAVDGYEMPEIYDPINPFEKQLRDFKDAILLNREPVVNGDWGKTAVDIVNEIYNVSGVKPS